MIDPDYISPRVPYASPLPLKPRLPGKPVQIMPPSPQRQGRRGYQACACGRRIARCQSSQEQVGWWEVVAMQAVAGPFTLLGYFLLAVVTAGLGLVAMPLITPFVCIFWLKVLCGDRSISQSRVLVFVLLLGAGVAAPPLLMLGNEGYFTVALGIIVTLSIVFGCCGALTMADGARANLHSAIDG